MTAHISMYIFNKYSVRPQDLKITIHEFSPMNHLMCLSEMVLEPSQLLHTAWIQTLPPCVINSCFGFPVDGDSCCRCFLNRKFKRNDDGLISSRLCNQAIYRFKFTRRLQKIKKLNTLG